MADVASLAVGLYLNNAFTPQLTAVYRQASDQSRRFSRDVQQETKKAEVAYQHLASAIGGVASRLAGLAGVGLSLGAVIHTSRQYSQALSDLSAITGATGEALKKLDAAAQQMGRTTEYSASQAAEALKLMASAKPELLNTAEGLANATHSALILAQASGTTLPEATRTLALSLNQFGASAEQADRYINVLAAGAKYGSSEIANTAEAIRNGGVAAAQAGVGFEQLNAAIQVLAEREVKGGQAGTALRNVILTLEKGTDKTLKPSVVGLVGALDTLAKKKLSTAQAVKLFGVENINAASILVDNRDKLEALTQALTGTQTAYEQSAIRVNNLNGDLMGLTSAFEGLVIQVGQSGNGPLRTGIQNITRATNALADNFTTVASVALYTLIPVLTTRLTAGLRESVAGWVAQQQAAKAAATQQAATARATLEQAQASRQLAQEQARYLAAQTAVNRANGIQLSYQREHIALSRTIREARLAEVRATEQLAAANARLSVSARAVSAAVSVARGALSLVGGPLGAAMLAGSALLYFHQKAKDARASAIGLKEAVTETTEALMALSSKQLDVKVLDLSAQYQNQITQRNQLMKAVQDYDSRLEGLSAFDPFGQRSGVEADKKRALADLEAVNQGAQTVKASLDNAHQALARLKAGAYGPVKPKQATPPETLKTPWSGQDSPTAKSGQKRALDQYQQLRQEIEQTHAGSLQRLALQEQAAQSRLLASAKAAGAAQSDLQRLQGMQAENYQRQRQQLAERYSPVKTQLRHERDASRELNALWAARLLSEQDYQTARRQLAYSSTQALVKAQAESAASPRLSLAGEVDPVVALQNQLVRQQSLLDAYYANGSLSKTQYEALMQKIAQDSADAQYQAALALYGGQSRLHTLSLSLAETLRERTTNMLTGLLTGARSFKESLSGLFASLAQSVIKNLVDMAAQALITKTILSSFMGGFGGGGESSAANAFSGGAYNGLSLNAKGGVYASPSLSAFSGQVVSQPTLFAFSHGAGLMGESGPEAIMPLKRGSDGRLGVQAVEGGGHGGDVIVNMGGFVFTTDERSDSTAGTGVDVNGIANQLKPLIINVVNEQAGRQGSPLWYAIKGR